MPAEPHHLRKQVEQCGLKVPDVIGFAEWIVEDPERRKKGLEVAKRDMDWAAQLGSPHVAAPPVGATVTSPEGPGTVIGHNVPSDTVVVKLAADGRAAPCPKASVCGSRKAYESMHGKAARGDG